MPVMSAVEQYRRFAEDRLYAAMLNIHRAGRACTYVAMEYESAVDTARLADMLRRLEMRGLARKEPTHRGYRWFPVEPQKATAHPAIPEDSWIKPPTRAQLMSGNGILARESTNVR